MASAPVIFSMSVSVLILVVCALSPYIVLRRKSLTRRNMLHSTTLSLCNCFAAGVFLATCYLGLIPHTSLIEKEIHKRLFPHEEHKHENEHDNSHEGHRHGSWLALVIDTNLMILIGFLFTLFIEQIVDFHQSTEIHENAAHRLCDLSARSCHKPDPSNGSRRERQIIPKNESADNRNGELVESFADGGGQGAITSMDEDSDANETSFLTKHVAPTEAVSVAGNIVEVENADKNRNIIKDKIASKNRNADERGPSVMRSILLLLAMSTHSFFEGIALGAQQNNFGQFLRLLISIMLHEVLCAFAYGVSLSRQRSRAGTVWAIFSSLLLASSIPLGMLLMTMLGSLENQTYSLFIRFILEGIAAGIFIYVACLEMLAHEFSPHSHSHNEPEDEQHHHHGDPVKSGVVVLGALVSFAVNAFIGH